MTKANQIKLYRNQSTAQEDGYIDDRVVIPIAVTIAGGVSLGAYEGGAIFELVRQLIKYNKASEQADRAAKEKKDDTTIHYKYVIDVITGASAGSMTAAALARLILHGDVFFTDENEALLSETDKRKDHAELLKTHPLYMSWVTEPDIEKMLGIDDEDGVMSSLFSMGKIENIGSKLIDSDEFYDFSMAPLAREIDGKRTLSTYFTLTSLTGYDREFPSVDDNQLPVDANECAVGDWRTTEPLKRTRYDNAFGARLQTWKGTDDTETTFEDDEVIKTTTKNGETINTTFTSNLVYSTEESNKNIEGGWATFKKFAICSGRFPVGFPPLSQARKGKSLGLEFDIAQDDDAENDKHDYFVDGGVLYNEPLLPAVILARKQDGGVLNPKRLFLVFDPFQNQATSLKFDVPLDDDGKSPTKSIDHARPKADGGRGLPIDWLIKRLIDIVLVEARKQPIIELMRNASRRAEHAVAAERRIVAMYDLLQLNNDAGEMVATLCQEADVDEKVCYQSNPKNVGETYRLEAFLLVVARLKQHGLDTPEDGDTPDPLLRALFLVFGDESDLNKHPINYHLVFTDSRRTKGGAIAGFKGLLDISFREHDFCLGRKDVMSDLIGISDDVAAANGCQPSYTLARALYLKEWAQVSQDPSNPLHIPTLSMATNFEEEKEQIRKVIHSGKALSADIQSIPFDKRERLHKFVVSRIDYAVRQLEPPMFCVLRWVAKYLVDKEAAKTLHLKPSMKPKIIVTVIILLALFIMILAGIGLCHI